MIDDNSSLALISARATITAIEVLTMLVASYLHALCQALDLRAMQAELDDGIDQIVREEVRTHFGRFFTAAEPSAAEVKLCKQVSSAIRESIEATSTMDNKQRMDKAARSTTSNIVDFFLASPSVTDNNNADSDANTGAALSVLPAFHSSLASRLAEKQNALRVKYLTGGAGPTPASRLLGRTKGLYEFIRVELGIRMHGRENLEGFDGGIGREERAVGGDISVIYDVSLAIALASVEWVIDGFRSPFLITGYPQRTHARRLGEAL
jgi:phenylalanine ammonia-lyase